MATDAPNPSHDRHEHLFHRADVEYAARLREETFVASRHLVRPCEICRVPIDLVTGQAPPTMGRT